MLKAIFSLAATAILSAPVLAADLDVPPHPGEFWRDAPLYSESMDGWKCHFLGSCRGESREDTDPAAIAIVGKGEHAEIRCRFGSYLLLSTDSWTDVWAPESAVGSDYRHETCDMFQWNGF